jgi:hypothetical protein
MNKLMINSYIIVTASIALFISCENGYADSPTFARQEIIDYASDWYQFNQSEDYFSNDARSSYFYANKIFKVFRGV